MSVAGLVLAAGSGSRYGGPKALVPFEGELLVERAVRLNTPSALLTSRSRVLLVEGTRVEGALPPRAVVEALGIRGDLVCPQLRTLTEEERAPEQ